MSSAKITTLYICYNGGMNITILSVGARPKAETAHLMNDFMKRLPRHIHIEWRFIKHGKGSPETSKQQEAELILRALSPSAKVVLLDEIGEQCSSPELAKKIFFRGNDTVFVIGGAYGVADSVKNRADWVWSLGKLVYPHQLVRIIIAEQLYRAYSIHSGHPYHHE